MKRKPYFVFMAGLVESLQGNKPSGGTVRSFDALAEAQSFAEEEKNNWSIVDVCERTEKPGYHNVVERYRKGKKGK